MEPPKRQSQSPLCSSTRGAICSVSRLYIFSVPIHGTPHHRGNSPWEWWGKRAMWEALVGWHCSGRFSWSCSSTCLGRNAIFKNAYVYTLVVTEKLLKTEAKQTTKIKIQIANANQNHPSFISSVIWQLAESTILRMALVLIGVVCYLPQVLMLCQFIPPTCPASLQYKIHSSWYDSSY